MLAAIGARARLGCAALLMQRGFKPRRTAVHPRNALRVADRQSFGLLSGFCCVVGASRGTCACGVDSAFGSAAGPVKAGSTRSYRRADGLCARNLVGCAVQLDLVCLTRSLDKKLPKKSFRELDDDRRPKRTSATAAFEPERPHLANTAAAARCETCSREHSKYLPTRHRRARALRRRSSARHRAPTRSNATMGQRVSLQEELINMKITSKQMVSASKKCEKNEKSTARTSRKLLKRATPKARASTPRTPSGRRTPVSTISGCLLE